MSLVDVRDRDDSERLTADVCIVGGGAAGITLALALEGSGLDVSILESGGTAYDARIQDLYAGDNLGTEYVGLDHTRLRFLGGSSNHWEGWCRPLDPEDLTVAPWAASGAWPFDITTLDPHYERAIELCELGSGDFGLVRWAEVTGEQMLPTDEAVVQSGVLLRSPPTRFGEVYRDALVRSEDVTVYLHANVVEILTSGRRVTGVRLADFDGTIRAVDAQTVVLATGGIENARLLLASDDRSPGGLGNEHDLVGRYFMEHPHYSGTYLLGPLAAEDLPLYAAQGHTQVGDVRFRGLLTIPPPVREEVGIGNVSMQLRPPGGQLRPAGASHERAKMLLDDIEGTLPARILECRLIAEQVPNPESRVMLGAKRDGLGMRRSQLSWSLHPRDLRTLRVGSELILRELGSLGLGRARSLLHTPQARINIRGGNHHMGTTRMHEDPRQGVVDLHGQVHGVENLYVAGSSVFPSSGWANPTLTVVALADRLAAHLREEFV